MEPKILVTSFNSWHMDHSAKLYEETNNLSGLYIGNKNVRGISKNLYRRCWSYHILMKPFYKFLSPLEWQQVQFQLLMPIFNNWLLKQNFKEFNIVQSIAWGSKIPFDIAEKNGALKILDAPNSHPFLYYSLEKKEINVWGGNSKPSVPKKIIDQVAVDIDRADLILCPSNWVKDSMVDNGVPESKCFINPFGVDTHIFNERVSIPKNPTFICTGSICLRKGHQYLFEAFKKVKEKYPTSKLICFGEVLSDFKHLWKKYKNIVSHYDFVPHSKLSQIYQNSTAFILPSIEEGFARSIIEAMASGLPILTTYESGATTLVKDGDEGIIFPSRNVDKIFESIILMIENPNMCLSMGRKARKKGIIENTWNNYGLRNLEKFNCLLNSKM